MAKQRLGTIGIYKTVNPKGKIYVGQSINIERREEEYRGSRCKGQKKLYYSIIKYGWDNHTHEIIEECSIDQLDEREIYWGMFYEVLGKNGLNCMLGSGKGYVSDDTLENIRKSMKNRVYFHSPETLIKMRKPKPEGFGEKVSKANLGRHAGMKGKSQKFKGRISPNKGNSYSHSQESNEKKYKPILQFDLQYNFIKEWPSIKQAKEDLSIVNISVALTGDNKTAGGFIWKYKNEQK